MNPDFLISPPPRLDQQFESGGGAGGGEILKITRRSFIKRTGGATVAAVVAWNATSTRIKAQIGGGGSGSGSSWVTGSPGAPTGYAETGLVPMGAYYAKGYYKISPISGYSPSKVEVTMKVMGWVASDFAGTNKTTAEVKLVGSAGGPNQCIPNLIKVYPIEIDRHDVGFLEMTIAANMKATTTDWIVYAVMEISSIVSSPDGKSLNVRGKCYLSRKWTETDYSSGVPAVTHGTSDSSTFTSLAANVTYLP